MDGNQFDDLLRELGATRLTRLGALRGLVAGALAGVAGKGLADRDAAAKAKKKGKGKGKGKGKKHKKGRAAKQAVCSGTSVTYSGQGITCNGSDCQLNTVDCDSNNTPYLLWVLTANGATSATITGPWGTANMTQQGGTFKYTSDFYADLNSLKGTVSACYTGTASGNVQLVISHGCPCVPETCPSDTTIPVGETCEFDDTCGGTYECPCDTDCETGGAPNSECKDGTCRCKADSCPPDKTIPEGETCTFDDGCCDTYECPCDQTCPSGEGTYTNGLNCEDGTCVCHKTPRDDACKDHCGETVDDGCCGTYTCDACACNSCTIGFYRQNGCRPGSGATPCAAGSSLCKKCKNYLASGTSSGPCTLDINKALTATGKDVVCAQAAAAYLNLGLPCGNNCTAGLDICNATNEQLTFANEGNGGTENCPLNAKCTKTKCV